MFRTLLDAVEADKASSQARIKSLTALLSEVGARRPCEVVVPRGLSIP
jgi:hypothetical protein